jgi:MFS family permease
MIEVGTIFAIHSTFSFFGNMLGGALTDKLGRKSMLIVGLIISAVSALMMGLINQFELFYGLSALIGLVSNLGGPAVQAMLADLLPPQQRVDGFGIYRVAFNLSVTIGPAIGGLVASISFLFLFILDCIISIITAVIVFLALPETKPETQAGEKEKTIMQTMGGYGQVFRDKLFIALLILAIISTIVYVQMNTTLSVFLRDIHNIPPLGYGYILSLNAGMVVLFQFLVTQKIKSHPPLTLMAIGTFLYAIGFGMYGFVATYTLFLFAMVIITIGEMIIAPVGQSIIANLAPEHMRGRYMAAFGINWGLSYALGPLLAGISIDKFNPNWVWYIGGILCTLSAIGHSWLQLRAGGRFKPLSVVADSNH